MHVEYCIINECFSQCIIPFVYYGQSVAAADSLYTDCLDFLFIRPLSRSWNGANLLSTFEWDCCWYWKVSSV